MPGDPLWPDNIEEDGEGLREEKKRNGRLVGASETSKSL